MRFESWLLLIGTIFQFQSVPETECAKILSAVFMSSKSHKIVYDPLLEALAARGHEITVLSPIVSKRNITNIREILTYDSEEMLASMPNLFDLKERNGSMNPFTMMTFFQGLCERSYALPQVKELLNQKFDLVIHQGLLNECMAGYLYKLNTSVVLIIPLSVPSSIVGLLGGPSPLSFVPHMMSGLSERMSFVDRIKNFLTEVFFTGLIKYYLIPILEDLYRTALGDPTIPGYEEIIRNTSLILSNSHFSIGSRRPFLPDVIEVGGMHCRPAKSLPKWASIGWFSRVHPRGNTWPGRVHPGKPANTDPITSLKGYLKLILDLQDLEDFAQSSGSDGFIFFSMGSALKGSAMPEKYRKIILSAFSKLKQKVLWKWETEIMEDLPPNVKLTKWAPQQDILGHSKLRVFITHGGLGSSTEAVYHGVPLIGIPMFADQVLNVERAVASGYAYSLEFTQLTEEKILTAIQTIISDPKYKEKVGTLSQIFRDQPTKPLDRAVYWTEYVLRHRGATHLRSAARDLNFFQYHSLDVIGTIAAVILMILYILYAFLRCIGRKLCCKTKSPPQKQLGGGSQKKKTKKTN